MANTRTIPTNKKGQVYYGPKTLKEAIEQINEMRPSPEYSGQTGYRQAAVDVADMMEEAGYHRIATIIKLDYVAP